MLILFVTTLDTAFEREYNNIEDKMVNLFYLGGVRYANLFCLFYFLSIITLVALVVLAYLIKLLIARLKRN